jgi:hypothetical protein
VGRGHPEGEGVEGPVEPGMHMLVHLGTPGCGVVAGHSCSVAEWKLVWLHSYIRASKTPGSVKLVRVMRSNPNIQRGVEPLRSALRSG